VNITGSAVTINTNIEAQRLT
jgi:hypothetical protein